MIAIMDMVFAFPDDETVYIGLFMVDHDVQGYGIGSIIIEEYAEYIRTLGKKTIQLAFAKGNLPE
ncbi:MAG: GNAT family N-acetyltransferase [Mediterraneibacter gnavus]